MVKWEIQGMEFANCNCAYGCPCQFNALPTHGDCKAIVFLKIEKGYFGPTRLDGLSLAFAAAWPGAVHQGKGAMQPIIDRRANDAQRKALLSIMTGKETDGMVTHFAVYAAMCEKIHDPVYTDITIDLDMSARTATCKAGSAASGRGQPILNPVTGKEHRAGIILPNGFEYGQNECGRGWSSSSGNVAMELKDSYAHWCDIHLSQSGRIH